MDDIKDLKSVLRSLVVSSPVQMTLSMLLRDYRNMMGSHLPIQKFGYRDALQFLRERCGDCFLGSGTNTVLIPIVPEHLKHIDEFVHKQKVSTKIKYLGKRRSINESALKPAPDLIAKTFDANNKTKSESPKPGYMRESTPLRNGLRTKTHEARPPEKKPEKTVLTTKLEQTPSINVDSVNKYKSMTNLNEQNKNSQQPDSALPSKEAFKNFIRKRLPIYESTQDLDQDDKSRDSGTFTSESEQRTLSSSSSTKAIHLEELKEELLQIVKDSPTGVCTTDLMKLYRERYGRELNFSRFGFASVSVLACSLRGVHSARDPAGGTRLTLAPPPAAAPRAHTSTPRAPRAHHLDRADDEDALPWIDFDPDVFPADCMSFSESIPSAPLEGVCAGAMLEVMVGEVYSPSHFWFYRLGEQYNIAMEDLMDEMTSYYTAGEGAARSLAVGAVRAGHYCSSVYERDWHRSLIVKVVDTDTVKVRHVDYGTVDRVAVSGLKPLLRRWGSLPAQAVRARLAGVLPAARGRRWPHAAAAAFLRLVQDRRLVANVVHLDTEENIVELFLVDTSTERDVRIDLELIRMGHADPRAGPAPPPDALAASYLYPRFDALENGDTPNFADIHAYLRDGIALEYVEEYSRHVPAALPAPAPAPALRPAPTPSPAPPPPPPRTLDNRVPLIPRSLVDVKSAIVSPIERRDETYTLSSTELVGEEPEAEATVDRPADEDPSVDESRHGSPAGDPRGDSSSATVDAGDAPDRTRIDSSRSPDSSREEIVPPAAPAKLSPGVNSETTQERPRPACRAYPMKVPDIRTLPRADSRPEMRGAPSFGAPLMPAPSMPALPFFVFPSPGPPHPPYPPYAMHPTFPPRFPTMDGYHPCPPQRYFHPQTQPQRFGGPMYPPPYSSGPVTPQAHRPQPAYSSPGSPYYSPAPTLSAPISVAPIPATSLSNAPVSSPTSRAAVTSAPTMTSSVQPTGVRAPSAESRRSPPPACDGAASGAGGARRVTTEHGEVTLTVSECEIFNLLSSVDPNAAHWYIVDALSRAMATRTTHTTPAAAGGPLAAPGRAPASRLNPEASEFRAPPPCRPPPGFTTD